MEWTYPGVNIWQTKAVEGWTFDDWDWMTLDGWLNRKNVWYEDILHWPDILDDDARWWILFCIDHISHLVKPAIWHWVHETRLELGCIFGAHLDPPSKPGGSHCLTMPGNWLICIPTFMASSILQCFKTSNNLKMYTSSLCRNMSAMRANSNLGSSQAKSPIVIYNVRFQFHCWFVFNFLSNVHIWKKKVKTNQQWNCKTTSIRKISSTKALKNSLGEVIAFCIAHILYQQLCASCVELRREGSD